MDAPIGGNPIKPVEVAQAVAADLEKVGIKPQLRTLDTATYAQMKFGYKLAPILMWNWMAFEADYILYAQAHSKAQFFHYPGHTPEVDRLMEQQRTELNPHPAAGSAEGHPAEGAGRRAVPRALPAEGHLRREQAAGLELGARRVPLPDDHQGRSRHGPAAVPAGPARGGSPGVLPRPAGQGIP